MSTATEKEDERLDEWTKPPFLRRVRIRGYKSIAFCDVTLSPLTILVGRNGAGKSNFLDALAFLRDVMDDNLPVAVRRRGGWSSIACRTASVPQIEFEIEVGFDLAGGSSARGMYVLRVTADALGRVPTIAHESFAATLAPGGSESSFEVIDGSVSIQTDERLGGSRSDQLLNAFRQDRTLLGIVGAPPFLGAGDGLRSMAFYSLQPDAMRRLRKPAQGPLERDGGNLAAAIAGLKETDPESVGRIRDYLALINENVECFDVATYGEYETVRFDLRVPPRAPPVSFDAASMSDGTLRALAALVAAFQINQPTGPSVVGIEEPETSLHPYAMRALVAAMDEATARTQVILTTHSAELLAGRDVRPGQVLVVRNLHGQTQITPVDPASREIVRRELSTLADLQRTDQLDLDEADLKRQTQLNNGAARD